MAWNDPPSAAEIIVQSLGSVGFASLRAARIHRVALIFPDVFVAIRALGQVRKEAAKASLPGAAAPPDRGRRRDHPR